MPRRPPRCGTSSGSVRSAWLEHLDREHAGDRAALVDHGPVLRLLAGAGRRARRAGRRRARAPARPRERSSALDALALERPLGQPAERAAVVVDEQRDRARRRRSSLARASATGSPTRTSGAFQRSTSRTRWRASRLSARSAPTKSSTKRSAGYMSSSAGGAYWASLPPFCRTAMRSPILIASSMSWVTKTIVLRISCWRRRNSFCSRSRLIGSIAPKGSSISISGGSTASARATPRAGAGRPRAGRGSGRASRAGRG